MRVIKRNNTTMIANQDGDVINPPLKPLITQQQGMVRKATIDLTRALKSLSKAHEMNGKCEDSEMMTVSETKIVINAVSNMEYTLSTIRKI